MTKFLLTNDDGIDAPGLKALREVASRFGEPFVVAPHRQISGSSHQITTEPIRVDQLPDGRHSVEGTPCDCVRIGLLQLAPDVDWVLSGINDGGNMGVDVFMSGTVGAAREAALLGKKAAAISQFRRRQLPFEWAWPQALTEHVLKQLLRRPLPPRCFWNVNLPADYDPSGSVPDIVFCPLDPHPLPVRYEWINGAFHYRGDYQGRQRRAGSDVDICFSGRVAVSLISLDQT